MEKPLREMFSNSDKVFALLVLHNELDAWDAMHPKKGKQNWQRIENKQKTLHLHGWKKIQQSWQADAPMLGDESEWIEKDQNKQKNWKK